jgi:hypothetical protein
MTDNKKLYESIMSRLAPFIKKAILEAEQQSLFVEFEDNESISVYSESRVENFMKDKFVAAYDPRVKAGSSEKDWNMYAVKIDDIKDCSCTYLGWNEGWPDYWTSGMTLYGKISIIKAGQGQHVSPDLDKFPGKLIIENDPKRKRLVFIPYRFDGKYEDMNRRSDNFSHFAHRCVSVPYDAFDKEISTSEEKAKNLIIDLSKGYRSYNALKRLIKEGFLEIKDGKVVKAEKK